MQSCTAFGRPGGTTDKPMLLTSTLYLSPDPVAASVAAPEDVHCSDQHYSRTRQRLAPNKDRALGERRLPAA